MDASASLPAASNGNLVHDGEVTSDNNLSTTFQPTGKSEKEQENSTGVGASKVVEKKQVVVPDIVGFVDNEMDAMKDMVPIIMKTTLSEFKEHSDNVIYAGKDLNWVEFVQMFITDQNPNDYSIKGDGGKSLLLDSKIGDYISTFKRPAKCYLVYLEQQSAEPSPSMVAESETDTPKEKLVRKGKRRSGRRTSPKRKRSKVIPPPPQKLPAMNAVLQEKPIRRRTSSTSQNAKPTTNGISHETLKSGDEPPQMLAKTIELKFKTDLEGNSSGDESYLPNRPQEQPLLGPPPHLKTELLNFMTTKVSNRDMLRIRQELMQLKQREDYFKFTSLTPLTAGLMEQMLCRDLPSSDQLP